jgi:hypothetical protein
LSFVRGCIVDLSDSLIDLFNAETVFSGSGGDFGHYGRNTKDGGGVTVMVNPA